MRSLNDIIGGLLGGKSAKPRKRRVMEAKPRPLGEAVARGLPASPIWASRASYCLARSAAWSWSPGSWP